MMSSERKIAIVTGASRENGIGTAICFKLAKLGYDIFFTHFSNFDVEVGYEDASKDWHIDLREQLKKTGVRCESMNIDFSDSMVSSELLNCVESTLGFPNILINNAAHCVEVDYAHVTHEIFQKHLNVNVLTPCMLSVEFSQRFGQKAGGRIINIVSGQDKSPEIGNLPYSTSKGAISTFTKTLALEVASKGITVNAIDPGPTDTGWMSEEHKKELLPKFPLGRLGTAEDACKLIAFLVSDEAEWITGQVIHSDGGFKD
ncbi:SDR family oxidoreductase [Lysinibacillus sphaericus]|nr:SDR family oxidoreductase [Lysinibacillus sphaericus]QTB15896.1 SDR family oxidoreductase [Lysinibacillus sphaericus]